jgi:hypothetical protein
MNFRLISKIGIRLLAVYMIATGIMIIPSLVEVAFQEARGVTVTADRSFYLVAIFSPFVFGLVLWFLAPYAAKWMVFEDKDAIASGPIDTAALQRAAFSVLGVYLVVMNFPVVVEVVVRIIDSSISDKENIDHVQSPWFGYGLYTAVLRSLFGLALVLGGDYLMRIIYRIKEFGLVQRHP